MDRRMAAHIPRITPAHAGKSLYCFVAFMRLRDHPRPCGEKIISPPSILDGIGSPPPMRGKVLAPRGLIHPTRITPAHAGKSHLIILQTKRAADHPRPCGEK